MSGETPRDAPAEAPSGAAPSTTAEGDRVSQAIIRTADASPADADGIAVSRPHVPRPSSRKPISAPAASPPTATPPQSNVIPPPAPLPRVSGFDALMGAEGASAARRRSRRAVNTGEDIGAAKTVIPDGSASDEDAFGSIPPEAFDGALDPFFTGSDSTSGGATATPLPGGLDSQGGDPGAKGFVALAPPLGSPFMLTGASSPAPPQSAPLTAPPPSAPQDSTQSPPADDGVIRPMRIITIASTADSVEISARTSNLPPDEIAPRSSRSVEIAVEPPARMASAPSITTELDALEIDTLDVETEPVTQPSKFITTSASPRKPEPEPEEEEPEEVELDRITVVDPIETPYAPPPSESRPQKKPPPPPPPKRAPGDPGPNSRSSSGQGVASFNTTPTAASSLDRPSLLPDPTRKRQKAWWEELFGDDFTRTMDHFDPKVIRKECDFIEERLGLEKGAVMLDLACGPGSHAVELASRGYSVVGYDLSLAMLARAADEAQERGQKLNFLHGDMREMAFEETFDGVYCWSMSFGYFEDEKNLNVLSRIRRALRKGGMLLLDICNRDYIAPRQPSLVWFEGDGCVCMDEMHVDFFSSRLRVKRTVMFEDGRSKEVDYSIRIYALHELGKMLHECGFKVVEVTGHQSHPGVFFGSESPRIIILAERD